MLFKILLLLLGVGFLSWLIGQHYSYGGIGAIGAAFVLIAGGAVVLTGLEMRMGSVSTNSFTTVNNSTVVNATQTQPTYATQSVGEIFGIGIFGSLGIGGLLMLLGATMLAQTLTE